MKRLFLSLFVTALLSGFRVGAEDNGGLVIAPRKDIKLTAAEMAALQRKLKSADAAEVRAAAFGLAASRDGKALPLLSALYTDGDAARRLIAVRALGRLGAPDLAESFFRIALSDPYQAIRLSAADELKRAETVPNACARLIKAASDEKMPLVFRHRALHALARTGGNEAAKFLAESLRNIEPDLASAAAEGLGLLGDQSQAGALIAALGSTHDEIKAAAADALERLTGQKFRFDLVKWSLWQKEHAAPPEKAPASPADAPDAAVGGESPPVEVKPGVTDIVVVFDTTGSMLHIWPQVSGAIDAVIAELIKQAPSLRMGTVKYRAADTQRSLTYLIKPRPLTRRHEEIRADVLDATFGGGSGGLQLGLDYAVKSMCWRMESRKIIILVGDTSPAPESANACARTILEAAQMDGLLVHTLYVRTTHGSEHLDTYRALARAGAGRFYEYNKAERHLVDMSAEKIDVKDVERPAETAKKWQTPR